MKKRSSSIKPVVNWLKERILAITFHFYDLALKFYINGIKVSLNRHRYKSNWISLVCLESES